jgi:nitroreductase
VNDTPSRPRPVTSETIEVLKRRVSVRRFRVEAVDDDTVDAVLRAAFRAPTSSNIQAYSVVVVRDPATRSTIAKAAGNQQHIVECPVFLAFCADLTRIELALSRHGHDLDGNNLEMGLVSTIDASLVGMSAYLAADSVGLKGVMIGAVRNRPEDIARALQLPPRVYCVFGMCLGYADEIPAQKPRLGFAAVVHRERYDSGAMEAIVEAYDDALARHYRDTGRTTHDESWTREIDAKFSVRPRDGLRASLARLGFDFR